MNIFKRIGKLEKDVSNIKEVIQLMRKRMDIADEFNAKEAELIIKMVRNISDRLNSLEDEKKK